MSYEPEISAPNRKYVSPSFAQSAPYYYPTIQAAIDSINDASATNKYAVYVYAGEYVEAVTLKSYVSLIGSGIDNTVIKSDGTHDVLAIGASSDTGLGQCYINNLSIDALGKSAIVFQDSTNAKNHFIIDVKVYTTTGSSNPAITIGNNESANCIGLNCLGFLTSQQQTVLFEMGIQVAGNGNLRMRQCNIYSNSYCVEHLSSAVSEAHASLMSSASSSFHINNGIANIYRCMTVGQIWAEDSAVVKHVNSYHDGHFTADSGATIWVTGMKWGEWTDISKGGNIDIIFYLNGAGANGNGSKIVVSNSRAGAQVVGYVVYVGTGCIFKAFNSEFNNLGSGETITGDPGVTIYMYRCVMNKPPNSNVTVYSDGVDTNTFNGNSE